MTRLKCKFKKVRDMYDKKYQNIVNSKSDFFRKIYLHYRSISLFFCNRFITTPLRACANYMESWSRFRRVFVWSPSYRRPIIPRTNVPGLLMRKRNFPHCIRFNLIDIFSAWTSESMPKRPWTKKPR